MTHRVKGVLLPEVSGLVHLGTAWRPRPWSSFSELWGKNGGTAQQAKA